ncbi:MAG: hypothetical protein M1833_001121 [Piccolia ochrophora]|nr:MAG: hypothetical protein M1833_001121 [Piccolia ochrophora]
MEAPTEDFMVSYEQLAELEKDFDDIDAEMIRIQTTKQAPLYHKRQALIAKIQNFWPLVFEQAPPDVDQFIQPSDSALLANSLKQVDVSRFEIEPHSKSAGGDPRSVAIRLEFGPNDHFEDEVLEKHFWFRRAHDGWTGLVSEPVKIQWKKGKDLTDGLTDLVVEAWTAEKRSEQVANGTASKGISKRLDLPEHKAIIKKLETASEGSQSFFAWFAFRGRHISSEESVAATKAEAERREKVKTGDKTDRKAEDDESEDEDAPEMELEIFPAGDDLAVAISEDLFPGALKYFSQWFTFPVQPHQRHADPPIAQAQEDEAVSDADFEDSDEDPEKMVDIRELVKGRKPDREGEQEGASKKRKT